MTGLTQACKIEISGLGWTASDEEREAAGVEEDFYILDLIVPEQDCTAVETKMREDAIIDEVDMVLRDQGIPLNRRNLWWHSHVNMGTSPSGTDENQIERFSSDLGLVSIITNKKGEMYTRVDVFKPVRQTFENCPVVVDQLDILPDGWAKDMVKEKVTEVQVTRERPNVKKYVSPYQGSYGYGGYHGGYKGLGKTYGTTKKKTNVETNATSTSFNQYYDASEEQWVNDWYKDDNTGIEVVPAEESEIAEVPDIDFQGCGKLQDAYEAGLITPNEAVRYYGKIKSQQMSIKEVDEELDSFIEFDSTPSTENEYQQWLKGDTND